MIHELPKNKDYLSFVFAVDLHGDMQEPAVVEKLHQFIAKFQPDLRVFGGDLFDFRALRKKAAEHEKEESLAEDFSVGMSFLCSFEPHYFLLGNHDKRLWDLAAHKRGPLRDLARMGINDVEKTCEDIECKILPYHKRDGILTVGKLKMLHGFASGEASLKQQAMAYQSCIFGHNHMIAAMPMPSLDFTIARAVGCLCKLDMDYNSTQLASLRQRHGWAYGVIDCKTGNYWCWQAYEVDGKWIVPMDFEAL